MRGESPKHEVKGGSSTCSHVVTNLSHADPYSSRYMPVLVPAITASTATITVYFSFISTPMNGSVNNYLVSYSFIVRLTLADCKNIVMLLYYP